MPLYVHANATTAPQRNEGEDGETYNARGGKNATEKRAVGRGDKEARSTDWRPPSRDLHQAAHQCATTTAIKQKVSPKAIVQL